MLCGSAKNVVECGGGWEVAAIATARAKTVATTGAQVALRIGCPRASGCTRIPGVLLAMSLVHVILRVFVGDPRASFLPQGRIKR